MRSSAVGEDGELSFAGLHDSLLNVPFRELLSSYKQVLASLYNPAALEYRIKHQIPFSDMAMAVLYQKMVPGQVSGVIYSIDPNAPHENVCLLTATRGLGKGVVEGSAVADTFRLSRDPPLSDPIVAGRWKRVRYRSTARKPHIRQLALRSPTPVWHLKRRRRW